MANDEAGFQRFTELRVLSFPFRTGNVLMLVLFSAIFSYLHLIWNSLGLAGIVLTVVLAYFSTLIYMSYLVFVAEYTALGYQYLPKLSMNVVDNSRWKVLRVLIMLSFFSAMLTLTPNDNWRAAISVLCVSILPIATGVLVVENSLPASLSPAKWLHFISSIQVDIALIRVVAANILFVIAVYYTVSGNVGLSGVPATLFLSMLLFRALGAMLHSNAESLGFPVLYGHQVDAAKLERRQDVSIDKELAQLKQLCDRGHVNQAFRQLEANLAKAKYRSEAYYFDQLKLWKSKELAVLAGRGFIERLVRNRDYASAIDVLSFCFFANGEDYSLRSIDSLIALASHVRSTSERRILARLLRDVPRHLPGDPKTADALLKSADLFAEDLDFDSARNALQRIENGYPLYTQQPSYKRLKGMVSN